MKKDLSEFGISADEMSRLSDWDVEDMWYDVELTDLKDVKLKEGPKPPANEDEEEEGFADDGDGAGEEESQEQAPPPPPPPAPKAAPKPAPAKAAPAPMPDTALPAPMPAPVPAQHTPMPERPASMPEPTPAPEQPAAPRPAPSPAPTPAPSPAPTPMAPPPAAPHAPAAASPAPPADAMARNAARAQAMAGGGGAPKPAAPVAAKAPAAPKAAPAPAPAKTTLGKKSTQPPAPSPARNLSEVFRQIRSQTIRKADPAAPAAAPPRNAQANGGKATMRFFGKQLMRRDDQQHSLVPEAAGILRLRSHFERLQNEQSFVDTQHIAAPPAFDTALLPPSLHQFIDALCKVWPTLAPEQHFDIAHKEPEFNDFMSEFSAFIARHIATLPDDCTIVKSDPAQEAALLVLFAEQLELGNVGLNAKNVAQRLLHIMVG